MSRIVRCFVVFFLVLMLGHNVSAQEYIISSNENTIEGIPISYIDSITHINAGKFNICLSDTVLLADTLFFNHEISDTLLIAFDSEHVKVKNPNVRTFRVRADKTKVTINAHTKDPFVCRISGICPNGQLVMDADTTCTIILDNLQLTSHQSAAICLPQKQKVILELPEGTHSILKDAEERTDTSDVSIGCLYAKGTIDFIGKGTLDVTGQYRHAIASGKNINIDGPHIAILDVTKNGIHCDKFTLKNGQIDLTLNQDVSKGIKTKKELNVKGGQINGEAYGNVEIKDGDVSYCTLLKSDGTMDISGGSLSLRHYGKGGRCISADSTMVIKGGTLDLETYGDGDRYLTEQGDTAYYTPKCMTINGCTHIERGKLKCISTGAGGKGIDCSDTLFIGRKADGFLPEDSLLICVDTYGSALVDNVLEDYRRGCPKSIKCDVDTYIYSGALRLKTNGQGGEGIESKGSLRCYYATIITDCYDDGINTGMRCHIDGSHIFCRSTANDGIDSNGKLSIMDGIVTAISEDNQGESFDTEEDKFYIYGGYVLGIGHGMTVIDKVSTVPYFYTQTNAEKGYHHGDNINLNSQRWLTVSMDSIAIMSLYHEYAIKDAFITFAAAQIHSEDSFYITEGYLPEGASICLDNRVALGGLSNNKELLLFFKTY